MRVFRSFEEAAGINSPVITTGTFDGVHIGHKSILSRLKSLSSTYGGESVLITFHPHPRVVLYPESVGRNLKLICTQEEKIELLSQSGLENLIVIDFTREFSRITGEEFVRDILCGILKAKVIVVGQNHHFGFNQEGDYRRLWEWRDRYAFEAEEIPMQEVHNETVSSTKIRQALSEGYIQRANAYLDRFYMITGTATDEGDVFSTEVPMIRIPVTDKTKLLPPPGLYATSCTCGNFFSRGMACLIEGEGDIPFIYFHPENYADNIRGMRISLFFHRRLSTYSNGKPSGDCLAAGLAEMRELIY